MQRLDWFGVEMGRSIHKDAAAARCVACDKPSFFATGEVRVRVSRMHASEGVTQALKRVESFGKHL